jgi:hypothetical protein
MPEVYAASELAHGSLVMRELTAFVEFPPKKPMRAVSTLLEFRVAWVAGFNARQRSIEVLS